MTDSGVATPADAAPHLPVAPPDAEQYRGLFAGALLGICVSPGGALIELPGFLIDGTASASGQGPGTAGSQRAPRAAALTHTAHRAHEREEQIMRKTAGFRDRTLASDWLGSLVGSGRPSAWWICNTDRSSHTSSRTARA